MSLQLVKGLQVSEGAVALLMAPSAEPAAKGKIEKGVRAALAKVGIRSVEFHVEGAGGAAGGAHHEHAAVGHARPAGPGGGGGPGARETAFGQTADYRGEGPDCGG